MPRCEQVYSPKGRTHDLCRLTGQACLVDSLDGPHCTRRIMWDQQVLRLQGRSGGAGIVVKMNDAPKGAAVQGVLL